MHIYLHNTHHATKSTPLIIAPAMSSEKDTQWVCPSPFFTSAIYKVVRKTVTAWSWCGRNI